jgi:hypothetical protein
LSEPAARAALLDLRNQEAVLGWSRGEVADLAVFAARESSALRSGWRVAMRGWSGSALGMPPLFENRPSFG